MANPSNIHETAKGKADAIKNAFGDLIEAGKKPKTPKNFGGAALERTSISEQVANRILGMIKSGNLKPGDQLPTEAQMCVAFSISRPPLREALKALTMMGVLGSRQGGRYSVTDLSASRLIEPFNIMLSTTHYKVHDHFEARAVVDLALVRFCAERAGDELRDRILHLARDGRAFHDDPVAFRLLDIEFHQSIYDGARNDMLFALAQSLYDVALDERRVASEVPGIIEKSVAQHCEIAEAIKANDPEKAVAAYREHLEHVRDTTIQSGLNTKP
jgi:GntR family transcriptional repressor for pyruvate dehydrogenase complex